MKLYGVFVGINKYKDSRHIRPLNYAVADAQQFHKLINERIADTDRETWLLTDSDATRTAVMSLIGTQLAAKAQEDDMILLYFSGHGSPETKESIATVSRYLIMYDTDYKNIFATGIDLEKEIVTLLGRLRPRWIMVLIDSCFSGGAGGRTFDGPNFADLVMRGNGGIPLQKLNLGEGRIIITACDDNEVALENSDLGHGVFTFEMLQVLTDHGALNANSDNQNTIGVGELYEQVTKKVMEFTGNRQHPILNGRIAGAQIPFLFDLEKENLL